MSVGGYFEYSAVANRTIVWQQAARLRCAVQVSVLVPDQSTIWKLSLCSSESGDRAECVTAGSKFEHSAKIARPSANCRTIKIAGRINNETGLGPPSVRYSVE